MAPSPTLSSEAIHILLPLQEQIHSLEVVLSESRSKSGRLTSFSEMNDGKNYRAQASKFAALTCLDKMASSDLPGALQDARLAA